MGGGFTDRQIESLRKQLEARREELREEIRRELQESEDEHYAELAGTVHDTGEESIADLLNDVNLAVIDNHVREVREIELALNRVRDGSYGICEDCGEDIALERLEAYPTATRCIQCQRKHEANYAGPGHSSL